MAIVREGQRLWYRNKFTQVIESVVVHAISTNRRFYVIYNGRAVRLSFDDVGKRLFTDASLIPSSIKENIEANQVYIDPPPPASKYTCQEYANGSCNGFGCIPSSCDDYRVIPHVSQYEKDNWPTEMMGPNWND